MIPVTQPFLPPLEEYQSYLKSIWKRNWLTNNGPFVNKLELRLKEYLDLNHLLFISNGTTALQLAIVALELKGDIITTPFSYVATTSSIVWEGCKPIFVDIDENTLNINTELILDSITEKTTAILATHLYGNPCDINSIQKIAEKYNLKVIYDAAHSFGVKYNGKSIYSFGDISVASFHATKLFHTVEGGAVVSQNPDLIKKMSFLRNFGHKGFEDFESIGINGKNSEFHAAMGLTNLKYIDQILAKRKQDFEYYIERLNGLPVRRPKINNNCNYNYSYYPILFENESMLIKSKAELEGHGIFPRRYFYPPLDELPYVESTKLPVTQSISKRVMCLPLYFDIEKEEIDLIARILQRTHKYC